MIKNLKLAIALMAAVSSMSANAQKKAIVKTTKLKAETKIVQTATESKTAKPTKQETMDWIAEKMKENLGVGREFISYKDGIFILKKEWKAFVFCETKIDLNKVTGMNNEYSKDFYISGKQMAFVHCDDNKPGMGQYNEFFSISGPNYNDYSAPFNFTPDQALVDRLKKAFATLIEYNSTQKGTDEKF